MKHTSQANFLTSIRGTLLLLLVLVSLLTSLLVVDPVQAARCRGSNCLFVPGVVNPLAGDLVISGVEITQAIQDSNNSVPLVANRQTVLRIYALTTDSAKALSNVQVSVRANRSGDVSLSESPLALASTIPLTNSRAVYSSTINFTLPSSWLSGTVDLTIQLDPENRIRETNEGNNVITRRLVFNQVAPLRIKIVPVRYTNSAGQVFPAPTKDTISDWILRTYPISKVEISWHTPYNFTGNLKDSNEMNRLLNEITTLKTTENAPDDQVYYGLIPTSNGSTTWFGGGVAGVGWISFRAAVGLEYSTKTSQIAAHEVGHNLGMWHTPCGLSSGTDPSYPYVQASIGQYGVDVFTGTLYNPTSNKDVMSYCDPKWISDYTYKSLYEAQVSVKGNINASLYEAGEAAAQRGLLVRAALDDNGAKLLPAYMLEGTPVTAPVEGDYLLQLIGQADEVLSETPVMAYTLAEENQGQQISINTVIPMPDQPATRLRLVKDGQVLDEQPLHPVTAQKANRGAGLERSEKGLKLRWEKKQNPSLVRYSADGGNTWTTLAVDVTGGELAVDPTLETPDAVFEVVESEN